MAPATLLCNLQVVHSLPFSSLGGCCGQILHLIWLTLGTTILLDFLQVHRIAIRQPRIIACPASNGNQHLYSSHS